MRKRVSGEMVTTSGFFVGAAFMGACLLCVSDLPAQGKGDSVERAGASVALEEIVVTATRREESVRDVPQAVSVLTGDQLAALGIATAEDYASFLPGLSFNRAGFADRAGLDLTVRGVSNTRLTDASAGSGALTTGFYINDVAVQPVNMVLYDIDRLELLKGPQGTLFGQASMGGTLRFITRRPDSKRFSATAEVSGADTTEGAASWDIRGVVNFPLVEDQLALRAVAYSDHEGGWIDWAPASLAPGAQKGSPFGLPAGFPQTFAQNTPDVNSVNTRGARLALRYTPDDKLSIEPLFLFQKRYANFESFIERNLDLNYITHNYSAEPRDEYFYQAAVSIDYDFPFARLTSVTAYFNRQYQWRQDTTQFISDVYGRTPAGGIPSTANLDFEFDTRAKSQELRLTSPRNDRFEWLIGAAYFDEDRPLTVLWQAPGFNQAVSTTPPNGPIPGGPLVFASAQDHANKNYSVFADATLKLFDARLHLTAGGRWFKQDFSDTSVNTGDLIGEVGTITPPDYESGSETGFVPRFAAKYYFAPTAMLYANVGKGFRAGGPSALQISTDACRNAVALAGIAQSTSFKSDSLINYELGLKTAFADGRAELDVAAFYIDWKDLQVNLNLNVYDPGCPSAVTTNAGTAKSRGGEIQITTRPRNWMLWAASATYTRARLGRPPAGASIGNEGDPLQNAPEWQGTVSGEFSFPVFRGEYEGALRADASYYGWQISNQAVGTNPFFYVPARALVNARLTMRPRKQDWSVELYVNNALNREVFYGAQAFFGEPGTNQALVGRPRQIGITLRKSWE